MVVYIRHANDNDHHTKYKHDPHITKEGIHNAKKMVHNLISKYGRPTEIYFSPFRRCIDTMRVMMHVLKKEKIRLVCDVSLSRYFTKSDKKDPKVSKKTLQYKVPIYESKKEFHKRVERHVSEMSKKSNNIWCITHALVYKNIAKNLNVQTNPRIEFLEHFSYDKYEKKQELSLNQLDPTDPEYVPMTERFAIIKNYGKSIKTP